jgi:hypothetical protein
MPNYPIARSLTPVAMVVATADGGEPLDCGGDDVEYSEHEFFPSIVLSQECCGPSSGQGLLAS